MVCLAPALSLNSKIRAHTFELVATDVKEELTKSMADFGFMIIQTLVTGRQLAPAAH